MDVNKRLVGFVYITKNAKKEWYQVKYEKLPIFCGHCGLLGHWHEECGDGIYDTSTLEWVNFVLVDGGRGRGRGRNAGRGTSQDYEFGTDPGNSGAQQDIVGRGRGGFGRSAIIGKGRGRPEVEDQRYIDWRWNKSYNLQNNQLVVDGNGKYGTNEEEGVNDPSETKENDVEMEDPSEIKKRVAEDSTAGLNSSDPITNPIRDLVPEGNTSSMVDKFDNVGDGLQTEPRGTPQKSMNKKKLKGVDGESIGIDNQEISAASSAEDRREQ